MEFLRFILSGFWVWFGFVILVLVISGKTIELVKACKRNRKVTVVGAEGSITTIENATAKDTRKVVSLVDCNRVHIETEEQE